MASNTHYILHKRHQHNLNQIKNILNRNNLTVAIADKNKALVIINKDSLEEKVKTFIHENRIAGLNKDPTDSFQKQIQQALQQCPPLIEKSRHKYLINIKPTAPNLNAYIKTHKEGEPIRPVIYNTQAPSCKLAKFLNKKLQSLIDLLNIHTTKKNSYEVAQELHDIQISEHNRKITLDIKDLYVNLPTKNILRIIEIWLNGRNHDPIITEQVLCLLKIIFKQGYLQYNNQFHQPSNGITMDSPTSGTLAEIYLQYLEEIFVKHCLENKEIAHYKRYVDDLLIVFDQNKINTDTIYSMINNIDKHLELKISQEKNNTINCLHLSVNRIANSIELNIYRKPTCIYITIHFTSSHPFDQKLAAFIFYTYINRITTLPITEQAKKQE